MTKIQNGLVVNEYDYKQYDALFNSKVYLNKKNPIKCPLCNSPEVSFNFDIDKTEIVCQNTKGLGSNNQCKGLGKIVLTTYHLLDDRFGQIKND